MGLYRSLEVVRRQAPRAIAVKQKVQDHANFHKGFDASPKFVVHCGKGMGQQKQSQQRIDSDALRSSFCRTNARFLFFGSSGCEAIPTLR